MSESFYTRFQLPKRIISTAENIENEFYFGIRLWMHTKSEFLKEKLDWFIKESFYKKGDVWLMKNHIDPKVLERHPKTSHDQTTAAAAWSVIRGREYHKLIWDAIKWERGNKWYKWFWMYDGHPVHPRDLWFHGYLVKGGKWRLKALAKVMKFTFSRDKRKKKKFLYKNPYREVWEHQIEVKVSEAYMWGLRAYVIDEPWFTKLYEELCAKKEHFKTPDGVEEFYFYHHATQPHVQAIRSKK